MGLILEKNIFNIEPGWVWLVSVVAKRHQTLRSKIKKFLFFFVSRPVNCEEKNGLNWSLGCE